MLEKNEINDPGKKTEVSINKCHENSAKDEPSTMQTHSCRASLLLMKRKWAGSQTNPAEWHASTQDWPSWETSSRRELRGGQADGAVTLDDHTSAVELGRATKSGLLLGLLLPAALCLDRLVGMKGGSGAQKSCRGRKLCHYGNQIFKIHLKHIFLDIVSEQAEILWRRDFIFPGCGCFKKSARMRHNPKSFGWLIYCRLCN